MEKTDSGQASTLSVDGDTQNAATKARTSESGNIFIIVFVAIILFAALIYTFSRGAPQGVDSLGDKQASLAASDILSYAQQLERAVHRIYRRGISENDISFENEFSGVYINTACTEDKCKVFKPNGGSASWKEADSSITEAEWIITASNFIADFPEAGNTTADLILVLPEIGETLCAKINEKLGVTHPAIDGDWFSLLPFTGTYSSVAGVTGLNGKSAGCVQSTGAGGANTTEAGKRYFIYSLLGR